MGRHKKYSRNIAVEKGIALFRKQGYHNTSAADIVDTIGIPKGTFFGMFQTKEEYAIEVLQRYIDNTIEIIDLLLYQNASISASKRISQFYVALSKYYTAEGCAYGCLLNTLTSEVAGYNDAFGTLVRKGHAQILRKIEPCIREAQAAGDFRTDIDSYELTYFIHTSYDGATLKMKGERDEKALAIFLKTLFPLIEN